jgi:hypothetical protein
MTNTPIGMNADGTPRRPEKVDGAFSRERRRAAGAIPGSLDPCSMAIIFVFSDCCDI